MAAIVKWQSQSYWFRTWIAQEIVLARHMSILCGAYVISKQELLQIKSILETSGGRVECRGYTSLWFDGCQSNQAFLILDMRPYKEKSLGAWMLGCENSLCTDLRDHVYGLLGLAYGCDVIANYFITLE